MILPKLTTLAANQAYITYDNAITLFSYDTPIVTKHNEEVILHPDWKYSSTTSRYRAAFLDENTHTTLSKLKQGIYDLKPYSQLKLI
jgi:hypothetical protein